MNSLTQCFVLLAIIGVNGFLALSEMALVSARKTRLQKLADDGNRGAVWALRLSESPTRFLASLQICITILGIAAGAWGAANLSDEVEAWINQSIPSLSEWSQAMGAGFVVAVETFLMVLLGELLPKRIALFFPERIAISVAPLIAGMGVVISPAANVLSRLTDQMIKILPLKSSKLDEATVTEDEIKIMVEQGAEAGVFDKSEESMLKRALNFADLTGANLMTPRTRIVSVDLDADPHEAVNRMLDAGFSHYPAYRGTQDNFVGIVSVKKMYAQMHSGQSMDLAKAMIPPVFLPVTAKAGRIIETMKQKRQHVIVLIDEFGGVSGLVTVTDLMEAVVGEVPGGHISDAPRFVQRVDGSWLVDGMVSLYELEQEIGFVPTETVSEDCETLSGLVMHLLDNIPREGQFVELPHWRFEVVDMDHNRIDKVLITKIEPKPSLSEIDEDDDENSRS